MNKLLENKITPSNFWNGLFADFLEQLVFISNKHHKNCNLNNKMTLSVFKFKEKHIFTKTLYVITFVQSI